MKYRMSGKERILCIGVYPGISLTKARAIALEARERMIDGIDPIISKSAKQNKKKNLNGTFEIIAIKWHDEIHSKKTSPKNAKTNLNRLRKYLFPIIGGSPIETISPKILLGALQKIESADQAHRLKDLSGQVLRYAIAQGFDCIDASASLKGLLPSVSIKNFPTITDPPQVGALLRAVWGYDGDIMTRAALQLLAYLFPRPGEMRLAQWIDFDLENATWDFKPSKGGRPMITPLPTQAVAILRSLIPISGDGRLVFPSAVNRTRPMGDSTLSAALQRMDYRDKFVAHSFRSMARTMLSERLGYEPIHIEKQLAHRVPDALGSAYNRTQFLEQRKDMLQTWADYLDSLRSPKQ